MAERLGKCPREGKKRKESGTRLGHFAELGPRTWMDKEDKPEIWENCSLQSKQVAKVKGKVQGRVVGKRQVPG